MNFNSEKTSLISETESSTIQFGSELAQILRKGTTVALYGDLGAGKTTLTKGIVASLTGEDINQVQSPTFTYLNIYEDSATPICHFDLYRLKNAEAFIEMGFLDYFNDENICIIEWPERISSLISKYTIRVEMTHFESGKRRIDVHKS